MSNRLNPDQARLFVGPDLGPICLQKYQQTTPGGRVNLAFPDHWLKYNHKSDRRFVGPVPDLGPICLQKLSADDTSR